MCCTKCIKFNGFDYPCIIDKMTGEPIKYPDEELTELCYAGYYAKNNSVDLREYLSRLNSQMIDVNDENNLKFESL